MSLEENKALVRKWIDVYNTHNLELFDEFIAPEYVDHTNKVDKEGLRQLFTMGFTGFPDWHKTIKDIIAEGDKVWIRLSYAETHTGEFMGVAPTSKKVTMTGVDIYRIENGKLIEYWQVSDQMNFNIQLGVIEYTEQGKQLFSQE
jgi:C-1 hydroxylase